MAHSGLITVQPSQWKSDIEQPVNHSRHNDLVLETSDSVDVCVFIVKGGIGTVA